MKKKSEKSDFFKIFKNFEWKKLDTVSMQKKLSFRLVVFSERFCERSYRGFSQVVIFEKSTELLGIKLSHLPINNVENEMFLSSVCGFNQKFSESPFLKCFQEGAGWSGAPLMAATPLPSHPCGRRSVMFESYLTWRGNKLVILFFVWKNVKDIGQNCFESPA